MTFLRVCLLQFVFLCSFVHANYYSQYGQDQYLDKRFFKNKHNRFFVELGAYDGISISNTLFLEKRYGWCGICIEPMLEHFEKLVANRKCICVNACISDIVSKKQFYTIHIPEKYKAKNKHALWSEMLSGILDEYDEKHKIRIQNTLKRFNGHVELVPIETRTLQSVFDEYDVREVDFISLDTEGGELKILKSIDYAKMKIGVIMVENRYNDTEIGKYLQSKGFCFDKKFHNDEIYYNPQMYN